jgi:hypothetical protein
VRGREANGTGRKSELAHLRILGERKGERGGDGEEREEKKKERRRGEEEEEKKKNET